MKKMITAVLILLLSLSIVFSVPAGLLLFNAKAQTINNLPRLSLPPITMAGKTIQAVPFSSIKTASNGIAVPSNNPTSQPNSNIQTAIRSSSPITTPLLPGKTFPVLNPNQQYLQQQQLQNRELQSLSPSNGISQNYQNQQQQRQQIVQAPFNSSSFKDLTPPNTVILSVVDGNNAPIQIGGSTQSDRMAFTIRGVDNIAVAEFQCSLDNALASVCISPLILNNLQPGMHVLQVRAVDTSGNVDSTPASFTWKVTTSAATSLSTTTSDTSNANAFQNGLLLSRPLAQTPILSSSSSSKNTSSSPQVTSRLPVPNAAQQQQQQQKPQLHTHLQALQTFPITFGCFSIPLNCHSNFFAHYEFSLTDPDPNIGSATLEGFMEGNLSSGAAMSDGRVPYTPIGTWHVAIDYVNTGPHPSGFHYNGPASTDTSSDASVVVFANTPIVYNPKTNTFSGQMVATSTKTASIPGIQFVAPIGAAVGAAPLSGSAANGDVFASWTFSPNSDVCPTTSALTANTNAITAKITATQSDSNCNLPVANAGPDQIVNPGDKVTLHGSATDQDNDPLEYTWIQLSGTLVQWTSAQNVLQPTFTAPLLDETNDANNVLQFQLGVNDLHGNEVLAVTNVRINHPPTPVISIFPSNTVGIGDTVTFDASKSSDPDPGDKIVSFEWQQKKSSPNDPDVPIVFHSANSDVIKFTAPTVDKETKVTFSLGLTDSYGGITVTEATVLVKPDNRPPVAVAQAKVNGIYIILDGSKSYDPDPADKVVAYKWTQIDNTGIKADLRGTNNDPNQYFIPPNVEQSTTLSFSLKVTDTHGVDSENDATVDVVINPCTAAEIEKVPQVEKELQRDISFLRVGGLNVGADTLELWMTGEGAELYPQDHPRQLSVSWLRSSIEIQLAQNAIHDLFQGPHNKGTRSVNSLSAFIDGLPNDRKGYEFTDNWDYAVPSGIRLTDYNIAVGGSQIHADGKFVAAKGEFVPNGVTVTGQVQYSLLDRFDWNKGTKFLSLSPSLSISADDLNLLEKCGHAAPFWSAGAWKQSVQGLGQDLPNSPPHMAYFWRDRND